MDISTQHCAEGKAKVSSFPFGCVGRISYILISVPVNMWLDMSGWITEVVLIQSRTNKGSGARGTNWKNPASQGCRKLKSCGKQYHLGFDVFWLRFYKELKFLLPFVSRLFEVRSSPQMSRSRSSW